MAVLPIVIACADVFRNRARYVLDSLMCACGVPVTYVPRPPATGPWIFYGDRPVDPSARDCCVSMVHDIAAWELFATAGDAKRQESREGLVSVLPQSRVWDDAWDVPFDIVANAFFFLSSWSERVGGLTRRGLFEHSVFHRLGVPQDIVDLYLEHIVSRLRALCSRLGSSMLEARGWPESADYAVVLSHDVDFVPERYGDIVLTGAKSIMRHLVRQRDVGDAMRSSLGLAKALFAGRDPYGCLPDIMQRETELGVRSSFQVAVGHRDPKDVNYHIEHAPTREYLRAILDQGFELCLHGSFRSTENPDWYVGEAELLALHLAKPIGSRQHFLSFDYDSLFLAQERAGIQYDMSMGYPDFVGPRAGFSYPYFPYNIQDDRPYRVLQICLFVMDVTLRSYMRHRGSSAWLTIQSQLNALRSKRGCASVVWHPIVFGGARDPGYDTLFWNLVSEVKRTNGFATDGRTINEYWRSRARSYPSFAT